MYFKFQFLSVQIYSVLMHTLLTLLQSANGDKKKYRSFNLNAVPEDVDDETEVAEILGSDSKSGTRNAHVSGVYVMVILLICGLQRLKSKYLLVLFSFIFVFSFIVETCFLIHC